MNNNKGTLNPNGIYKPTIMPKYNQVGLDKQIWNKFSVPYVEDMDKLLTMDNVMVNNSNIYKRSYMTSKGQVEVGKIKIYDRLFNLELGVLATKGDINHITYYEKLEFNPSAIINGINFNPITTAQELQKAIDIIKERLLNVYGMTAELEQGQIRHSEITVNIPLQYQMSRYEHSLDYILRNVLPKTKKKFPFMDNDSFNGFYCGNEQIELKFYEKNKECGIQLPNDTLRIEYKALTQDKVLDMLQTTSVKDILKDFTIIDVGFRNAFNKDIYNNLAKAYKKTIKENLKMLEKHKDKRYTLDSYLASVDVRSSFDYEIIERVITKTDLITKGNKSRAKKKALEKIQEKETSMIGHTNLINEILVKLTLEPINFKKL